MNAVKRSAPDKQIERHRRIIVPDGKVCGRTGKAYSTPQAGTEGGGGIARAVTWPDVWPLVSFSKSLIFN